MSNTNDVILWAIQQGDNCPSLSAIEQALAAGPAPVVPLPEGVTFDPSNTGAVNFSGAKDPGKRTTPYLWSGALPSLKQGSQQYAQCALNTITARNEEAWGWLITIGIVCAPVTDPSNGTQTWHFDQRGTKISPPTMVIPSEYDTLEKALAFIDR